MINGLYHTKMEGVDNILLNILNHGDLDLIRSAGGHTKMVATAFAQFPLNIHQCDGCLCQVGNPILTEGDFTAFLHTTDRSQKALHSFMWKHVRARVNEEIERLYTAEVKTCQDNIMAELQVLDTQH